MPKHTKQSDRRQYIRLDSVFPVEIYLGSDPDNKKTHIVQAFTRDVSLGGICIFVNDPGSNILSLIENKDAHLDIAINMPVSRRPIEAKVKVAWHEIRQLARYRQLLLGVYFDNISPRDKKKIVATARKIKWLPIVAAAAIIILGSMLVISDYRAWHLRTKNTELIENFRKTQKEVEIYQRSIGRMDKNYEELTNRIADNQRLIEELDVKLAEPVTEPVAEPAEAKEEDRVLLEEQLAAAKAEKEVLSEQLRGLLERKERATRLYDEVKSKKRQLESATLNNMYRWLVIHRNRFTGLVMSFEGDPAIKDWGFTYDQSLASQAFLISSDIDYSGQILNFFDNKAKKTRGGFVNAYNVVTGTPAEEVVHLGPNIWMGIAAAQYTRRTGSAAYLGLAENVARWVMKLKDSEGGLRGGPGVSWYSTEHNLDAYALFKLLYSATGKDIYRSNMQSTLRWIRDNTYSRSQKRMIRGKGDSTIATDTLAWAIAAIGPQTLKEEGMDPDAIMKFAEENCMVKTRFKRPDGEVIRIEGFDFAKSRNIARNGVVSTEWTAQMVISYNIMADYYRSLGEMETANAYADKASFFLGELDKMIISSPSPSGQGAGCLPYASQASADTGHGWRTPSGRQTGSVAGTAYTIFAKKGYNPLGTE